MTFIDPLHLCIALGPLATYLLVLGMINLSRRPVLTSGARDAASLAIAVSGLVIVGPMELFLVEEAVVLYGGWVWALMLVAYLLAVLLVILMMRPRLVIYNGTLAQIRSLLADVVTRLDSQARWAGDSLTMPQLGVHLHIEALPLFRNVQLVSSGPDQSLQGWRELELELSTVVRRTRMSTQRDATGALVFVGFIALGMLIAGLVSYDLTRDPAAVTEAMNQMLRR